MALIIDIETIGFPRKGNSNETHTTYKNIYLYNSARIVQVSMMVCDEKLEQINLHDFIVKADNFKINNSHIHGITDEMSAQGIPFINVATTLYDNLKQVSHIIAHNAKFDVNVLKSELYRHKLFYIIEEFEKKEILCSMLLTKNIVNAKNKLNNPKLPSLNDLYKYIFNSDLNNAHNAKYDVINLHLPIKQLYDDNKLFNDKIFIYNKQTISSLLKNKYCIEYEDFLKDIRKINKYYNLI
jgi:DNA polymerase III epsilon subunit-like protein